MTPAAPPRIIVSDVTDFASLGRRWRDLETRAEASFFQSWTWTGCLGEERFPQPVLVEATEAGRTVALALFNRVGRDLYLGESGDPARDSVYIEHNGVLAETGREAALTEACLRAARVGPGLLPGRSSKRRLVLNGVNRATCVAAHEIGYVFRHKSATSPAADLSLHPDCYLDGRSANTRQQIRRSDRAYAAKGSIVIARAADLAQAHDFLDALSALHQTYWTARGKPGAFANPFFCRFHRTLIARALPRNEVDLLRVSAGIETIGYLYNFRYRGRALAYQSGFAYAQAGRNEKPGLSCHHQAIQFAARNGLLWYDFLAGDDRYKRSLADQAESVHWLELPAPWSLYMAIRRAKAFWIARRDTAG